VSARPALVLGLSLALGICGPAPFTRADAPFAALDAVSVRALDAVPQAWLFVGTDGLGFEYFVETDSFTYCRDPAAPATTFRSLYGRAVGAPGHDGIMVANGLHIFSCREAQTLGTAGAHILQGQLATLPLAPPAGATPFFGADGSVCAFATLTASGGPYIAHGVVDCYHRDDGAPAWTRRFTTDGLDDRLGLTLNNPSNWASAPQFRESWTLRFAAFVPRPSGPERMVVVVMRDTYVAGQTSQVHTHPAFVLEVLADGTITPLHLPPAPFRQTERDVGAIDLARFVYDARFDALLFPATDTEYSQAVIYHATTRGQPGFTAPRGPGGSGFLVMPLDRPGIGWLSLTHAQHETCYDPPRCSPFPLLWASPGGVQVGWQTTTAGGPVRVRYQVDVDLDRVDLDEDGLGAGEERALGSSDTMVDSDGGGLDDSREVALVGSDPSAADDDTRPGVTGRPTPVMSQLVRLVLPGGARESGSLVRSFSADAPLCARGTCWDAAGREVGSWDDVDGAAVAIAADGRHIVQATSGGVVATTIATGDELTLADDSDPLYPPKAADWRLVPVDGRRAWLVDEARGVVLGLAHGEPIAVVFDLSARWCGGPSCGFDPNVSEDQPLGHVFASGLAPDDARLVLSVPLTWRVEVLLVGMDGDVAVLDRETGAIGWPQWLVPLGEDMSWGAAFTFDGANTQAGTVFGPALQPQHFPGFATWNHAGRIPTSAWGGTLLIDAGPDREGDGLGQFELVLAGRGALGAGDALLWGSWSNRTGLMHTTPRGGLHPIAEEALDIYHWRREYVTGLGLSRDHMLCIANHGLGVVREQAPDGVGGYPTLFLADTPVAGVIDCAYDDDGSLLVLRDDPPSVLVREGPPGTPLAAAGLDAGVDPIAFVTEADGTLGVLDRASGTCGRVVLASGDEVTVSCEGELLWNGRVQELDLGDARAINTYTYPFSLPGSNRKVELAERPDGRIALANGGLWVVDLANGKVVRDIQEQLSELDELVIVPGGARVDPWSGEPAPSRIIPRGAGVTFDPVAVPEAPTGGEPLGDALPAPRDEPGCAGAGGGVAGGLMALAAVMALARRRRCVSRASADRSA